MSVRGALASAGVPYTFHNVGGRPGGYSPRGVLCHHTASRGPSATPALGICLRGRTGLPGPLCQILIGRDGSVHVLTEGRANHAGSGSWPTIGSDGNGRLVGIEAENDGVGETWGPHIMRAYRQVCRALLAAGYTSALIGHKEWTSRKSDPSFPMGEFRASLGAVDAEGDDMFADSDRQALGLLVRMFLYDPADGVDPNAEAWSPLVQRIINIQDQVTRTDALLPLLQAALASGQIVIPAGVDANEVAAQVVAVLAERTST